MELEAAVTRTLEDSKKLKLQIQSIIDALKRNSQIIDLGLCPPLDGEDSLEQTFSTSESTRLFNPAKYKIIDSETFLIPYIDKWIWGTTVVNTSDFSANLPQLTLMPVNNKASKENGKSGHVLSYSYDVSVLEVPFEFIQKEKLDNLINIPINQQFCCQPVDVKVPPGCKATVTCSFSDPLGCSDALAISASIFCDRMHQFSTTFVIKNVHACTLYNDDLFKKFQPQILSTLTSQAHKEVFSMEKRFSKIDRSPSTTFRKFLSYLGFDLIKSVQIGSDTWTDTLTSEKPTLLLGAFIQQERNLRNMDCGKFSISTKSSDQMWTFFKLLSTWANQESADDRNRGLKGLVITRLTKNSNKLLAEQLVPELELLEHLLTLQQRQLLTSDFSKKWLAAYLNYAARTESYLTD